MSEPNLGDPLWTSPPDGETTEEMLEALEDRRAQEEIEKARNRRLWDNASGYFGRDGQLVVKPPRSGG